MKIALVVLGICVLSWGTGCTCSCKKGVTQPPQPVTADNPAQTQLRVEIKEFPNAAAVKQVWQKIKDGSNGNYQVVHELQLSPTYVTMVLSSSLPGPISLKKTLHNMFQNDAVRIIMAGEQELVVTPR